MNEMELLLSEVRSLADDMLISIDRAGEADTIADAKSSVQDALRSGEEMMDRLEESFDLVEPLTDQAQIDLAINDLEDALDAGQIALTSGDMGANLEHMRLKVEDTLQHLITEEAMEDE
jgi:hypothetical protein